MNTMKQIDNRIKYSGTIYNLHQLLDNYFMVQ